MEGVEGELGLGWVGLGWVGWGGGGSRGVVLRSCYCHAECATLGDSRQLMSNTIKAHQRHKRAAEATKTRRGGGGGLHRVGVGV